MEVVHLEMRSWVEVTFGVCLDEGRGAGQARGEAAWEEPTVGLGGMWKAREAVTDHELDPDLLCGDRIPNCTVWEFYKRRE